MFPDSGVVPVLAERVGRFLAVCHAQMLIRTVLDWVENLV